MGGKNHVEKYSKYLSSTLCKFIICAGRTGIYRNIDRFNKPKIKDIKK